jgi:hypothetical protein
MNCPICKKEKELEVLELCISCYVESNLMDNLRTLSNAEESFWRAHPFRPSVGGELSIIRR